MGRLRSFDLTAALLLFIWVLESELAHAPAGMRSLEGWEWWRAAIGHTVLPLPGVGIYLGMIYWAAKKPFLTNPSKRS